MRTYQEREETMTEFNQPFWVFEPNPLDPTSPVLHLSFYNSDTHTWENHRMSFAEAFTFCARLSQEVAAIALRSPAMRQRVKVREIDAEPEEAALPAASTNSYKSKRGLLARILGKE